MFTTMLKKFNRGDIVWGKMKFFWWPAMVLDPGDCGIKNSSPNKYVLFWFGDYNISQVVKKRIAPFQDKFQKFAKRERLQEAVNEALTIIAAANDLTFDNGSALVKWACEGFPATVKFRWSKPDLPQLIQKALPNKPEAFSDENDTKDDVKKMIVKVLKGEKSLDEICIGCCKENATLVQSHPLFLGKVCAKCKKYVDRISNLPCGADHKYCRVCGQGGSLVYCSKRMCSRAFCKECIQYLDSEDAFTKITSLDEWPCYVCDPVKKENCLIRKRATKRKIQSPVSFTVPVSKKARQDRTNSRIGKVKKENCLIRKGATKRKIQSPVPDTVPISKKARQDRTNSRIDHVIAAVMIGIKDLDDICIACCKEGVELVCNHPLFIGKICKKCKKDVMKVWSLPSGKFHNFCIVCGQGGSIVYCSNDVCLRAFCKECIEYLDCEDAFDEIVKAENWFCYLCKKNLNKNCLIKKREEIHEGIIDTPPTSSDAKFSEISIDSEEIATAFDNAANNGGVASCSTSYVSDNTATSSDNAADDRRFANFTAADSSKSSFYIKKEPSDSTTDDERSMDYSTASAYDRKSSSSIVIREVREGKRYLEDICIACRKIDAYTITDHPLLIGNICCHCHLDVLTVCNDLLPKDRVNFCVICGQESVRLLCCSYKDCSRAYCKICVESLDSKEAFAINVEDKNWLCYLSEAYKKYSFKEDKFLIKQRSPVKHREYITRNDRLRRKNISEVEGDLKMNVREGVVKVEDICIACHKGEYELMEKSRIDLVVHHPLFFGSICESCVHDVATVCKLPYEKAKDLCIVCGQHGYLVRCSEEECSKAYCRKCIEFLDSEVAFNKMLKNSHWQCYFCKFCKNKNCIIQRRFPPDNYSYDGEAKLEVYTPEQSTEDNKKKLWSGELALKDVCIACLELITDYPMPHPLFKGKVCLKCLDEVHKACSLRCGTMHDQCVVCGQGGDLIYCSNSLCLKAYCKPCIECLDVEKAYSKILENENWFCYFCDLHPPSKIFIQRKEIHKKGTKNYPEVPKAEDRSPINVLATNDRGLDALKKAKIKVEKYDTDRQPISRLGEKPILYDLVLGSFFVEDKEKPKEKLSEDFFRRFIHFNNRRLDCGFHDVDHNLYYIFIGDYLIMDADMVTKVAEKIHVRCQFHTILPVLFHFGERKFLAWSNLSYCMPPVRAEVDGGRYIDKRQINAGRYIDNQTVEKVDGGQYIDKRQINAGRYIDNQTVEKEIYYFFLKYLQKYFKPEEESKKENQTRK